jgi:hypothetical protein
MQGKNADEKLKPAPQDKPTSERLTDMQHSQKQEGKEAGSYLQAALDFLSRKR